MTDIVKRLRGAHRLRCDTWLELEAADEIERLRAANEELKMRLDDAFAAADAASKGADWR